MPDDEHFLFSKDMTHVRRMLKPSGANQARALFEKYSSVLRGTFDAMGSHRYADAVAEARSTLNVQSVDSVSVCPEGFVQYVFMAHTFHNEPAVQHTLWLTVRLVNNTGGINTIKVCPHALVDPNVPVELPRPIVIPPRGFLQGRADAVIAVGSSLTVEYFFINVPIGEYVKTP